VVIGHGGFGAVYRATDADHGRDVAIKVLSGELDSAARRRFDRERQTMGRLSSHPNIVTIYESGYTSNGEAYLVMELAEGGSLRERLSAAGPLPWEEAAEIVAAIAAAAQAAHDNRVLHRDIKPDNILIDRFGNPKLTDFGIATVAGSATAATSTTATLAHAAPEMLQGEGSTPAVDIYALGSTLFSLLNGRPPFLQSDDVTVSSMIGRTITQPPPDLRPLGVPEPIALVVERALAKSPTERQPTADDLARELREAAAAATASLSGSSDAGGETQVAPTAIPPGGAGSGIVPGGSGPVESRPVEGGPVDDRSATSPIDGPPSSPVPDRALRHEGASRPGREAQERAAFEQAQATNRLAGDHSDQRHRSPETTAGGRSPFPGGDDPYAWAVGPGDAARTGARIEPAPTRPSRGRGSWGLVALALLVLGVLGVAVVQARSGGDDGDERTTLAVGDADGRDTGDDRVDEGDLGEGMVGEPEADGAGGIDTADGPTITIDCPDQFPLGVETTCSIITEAAVSGEWDLPGFLLTPEVITPVPGRYPIFVHPTDDDALGRSFVITATVRDGDGREATTEHQFQVVSDGPTVQISCPDEVPLDQTMTCEIASTGATSGRWDLPDFGAGELEVVPGTSSIFVAPDDPAAVGRTFTLTATVRDDSGRTATASADLVVVS
jgi:serine/threonine protein kinase